MQDLSWMISLNWIHVDHIMISLNSIKVFKSFTRRIDWIIMIIFHCMGNNVQMQNKICEMNFPKIWPLVILRVFRFPSCLLTTSLPFCFLLFLVPACYKQTKWGRQISSGRERQNILHEKAISKHITNIP